MSITVTDEDIGRAVIYRPGHGNPERGVITGRAGIDMVHVRYGDETGSKATNIENLEWPDEFLIWSEEHGRWWRPHARGYTDRIAEAGRYPRFSADAIVKSANYLPGVFNEIAIPAPPDLDNLIRVTLGLK